jgi:hypothetical protein
MKYYDDKIKLALNIIIQLDNILQNLEWDSKEVKLPLFQALGMYYPILLYRVP